MMNTRVFLVLTILGYALLSGTGIWLFQRPGYSAAYLEENQQDHKRYLAIKKTPAYQLYVERPHLNPLEGSLLDEALFAQEYTQRPAFKAEQKRMFLYTVWFKVLNASLIFLVIFYFGYRPILAFLDGRIKDVEDKKDRLEKEFKTSFDEATGMRQAYATLPDKEAALQASHDAVLQKKLAQIEEQTGFALKQIEQDAATRIAAEEKAASVLIRQELVNSALHELESRYRQTVSTEHLEKEVESFCRIIGFLS